MVQLRHLPGGGRNRDRPGGDTDRRLGELRLGGAAPRAVRRPFLLDLKTSVLKVMRVESTPAAYPHPPISTDGTHLALGPALLKKGQEVRITVLTDQPVPAVEPVDVPLIDVKVRRSGPEDAWLRRTLLAVAPFALIGIYPELGYLLNLPPADVHGKTAIGASIAVLAGCETVLLLAVWRRARQILAHYKMARP